ncbi:hypothetical protein SmJEL517_g02339 [Synchytrium microbalum]|uniref:Uncharacterized protein n=1 Tax=Synchytrium microbalum TaxID=1806994 RepID=A0A507C7J2_9FUNG|nr:uncharacterized protein SmJEL517_g02339 [Synchytrium microbalum]TPX35298.1 hypothetical protein SmJEL517_g02339 [Synchytrium microbalum]
MNEATKNTRPSHAPKSIAKRITISPDSSPIVNRRSSTSFNFDSTDHQYVLKRDTSTGELIREYAIDDVIANDIAYNAWLMSKRREEHSSSSSHNHHQHQQNHQRAHSRPSSRSSSHYAFFSSIPTHRMDIPTQDDQDDDEELQDNLGISRHRSNSEKADLYIREWFTKKNQELEKRAQEEAQQIQQEQERHKREAAERIKRLEQSDHRVETWRKEKLEIARRERERQHLAEQAQKKAQQAKKQQAAKSEAAFQKWKKATSNREHDTSTSNVLKHPKPWTDPVLPSVNPREHQANTPPILSPPALYKDYERTSTIAPAFMKKYPSLVANAGREVLQSKEKDLRKAAGPRMHKGKSDFVSKRDVVYPKHHAL